jgi:hypothetical protein
MIDQKNEHHRTHNTDTDLSEAFERESHLVRVWKELRRRSGRNYVVGVEGVSRGKAPLPLPLRGRVIAARGWVKNLVRISILAARGRIKDLVWVDVST